MDTGLGLQGPSTLDSDVTGSLLAGTIMVYESIC